MTNLKLVDSGLRPEYLKPVADKEATEFDSSNYQRRTSATRRYFFVRTMLCLLWAAVVGRLRPAGFLWYRSVNPAICRPPRLTVRGRINATKGGSHA
jgi:hypothetical protein